MRFEIVVQREARAHGAWRSVVGAAVCFAITPLMARLTRIRFELIAAALLLIMVAGAYQATETLGDFAVLLVLGSFGWL